MQVKHSFLLIFLCGVVWTGFLFAYSGGPDPAVNGIAGPTCDQAGCHDSFVLNTAGGSVALSGLPAAGWVAGQVYPLTVTVQRTGQRVFGFQLSAVVDSTNRQAGSLSASGGAFVQCGTLSGSLATCSNASAIQFAEHNFAKTTGTFAVNWTAPSDASVGMVRFNVAGNAANGNGMQDGDYIYTTVIKVGPAATVDNSVRPFTLVDRGGSSVITDGSGDLSVGYARIQPSSGSTTPTGVAIFGFRQNNTLVTEAGVPASPLLTSARTYAEVNGPVNTGLAIANPNSQAATINFHFTDAAGIDFGAGSTSIPANQQTAKFLDQAPFNGLAGRATLQGTFSFTSNVPVSVIALRGLTNERGEFLITTLPITDLSAAAASGTVYLPHFADGGGWITQIVLVNPSDTPSTGTIQFFGQGSSTAAAGPVSLTANGQAATSFNYTIPRQSSFKLVTAGLGSATAAGSVRVNAATGPAPSSLVVFSYKPGGTTVSEAGVPGIQGSAFRMYVEETDSGSSVGTIQTGLAITNAGAASATVNLELTKLDGTSTGQSAQVTIAGNGQVAKFVHELFNLTFPFKGILRISGGTSSGLSVVGLRGRYNERGDFLITTTPPSNEAIAASSAELSFPHLVNGGGYTTQFVLFSGAAGQTSSGNLRFLKQDGSAFSLTVN